MADRVNGAMTVLEAIASPMPRRHARRAVAGRNRGELLDGWGWSGGEMVVVRAAAWCMGWGDLPSPEQFCRLDDRTLEQVLLGVRIAVGARDGGRGSVVDDGGRGSVVDVDR